VSHVTGRGRYARETYPEAPRPVTSIASSYFALQEVAGTNSIGFTDLLVADVNSTGNDSFLIWASVCCDASSGPSHGAFRLTLDGNELANISWKMTFAAAGDSQVGGSQVALSAIPAGTRTIAIQWAVADASGAALQVDPGARQHASLLIMRLTG
jgi:hypothetical protein